MKTLIKYPNPTRYSEILQSISLLFSFVSKKGEEYHQLFHPVKCRDFLGDCIWSKKTGNQANIYSFYYNYKEAPYDTDMLRMSLTFPTYEVLEYFKNNFIWITKKENDYKIKHNSHYFSTKGNPTLIIEADPIWQSSTWKLSLFTYYLKLMCYEDIKQLKNPESEYARLLTPKIEDKLLSKLHSDEEVIPSTIDIAHNFSGFVSICRGQNKEMHQILLKQQ
jgi:hypothetical protein